MNTAAAPIEDFLEAITAQLDKTQDALRLKAVNRPLTFALKDFRIDLAVFVEMDRDGLIRLRPSGPNETGASTMHIEFTTITRPMIEENTVSMEATHSPSLEEAGFAPDESLRLNRLGVRNTSQLERLRRQSNENSLAEYSGVDLGRLKKVIQQNRSRVDYVEIGAGRKTDIKPGNKISTVPIRKGQSRLKLRGIGLSEDGQPGRVTLGEIQLPVHSSSYSHLDVQLPMDYSAALGFMEVELPDGSVTHLEIINESDTHSDTTETQESAVDETRWSARSNEEGADE